MDARDESKQPWEAVEESILQNVFYAHQPGDVRASADLARQNMLDSLSIVAVLEILVEASGNEAALAEATAADFVTVANMRALYERL